MIRFFIILLISLLWSNASYAKTNQICKWIVDEVYQDLLKEKSNDYLYVVMGNDGRCEYGRGTGKNDGLSDCKKQKKLKGISGECKLFAIGKKRILENIGQEKKSNIVKKSNIKAECHEGDCVNGEGTVTWPNGDTYSGSWKNGKHHGIGTFEWIDGSKYSGEWEFGLQNGEGTVTWPNGDKYIGNRKNNQADGFGLYIYANGDKVSGQWKKGELVNEVIKKTAELSAKKKPIGEVIWQKDFQDNNNECKILKKDPSKIYYRNFNWKSEAKNIKKKKIRL